MSDKTITAEQVAAYLERRAARQGYRDGEVLRSVAFQLGYAQSMLARVASGETTIEKLREELRQ